MRTITCELVLKDDHTATITLPDDIPAGKHQVVLVIDEHVKDGLRPSETFDALLSQTSGLWKQGDGLRYQENIRNEWDRCP